MPPEFFYLFLISIQLIRLIAEIIIDPPIITQISIGSEKNTKPTIAAQTKSRKTTGWVTFTGAALNAIEIAESLIEKDFYGK